MKVAGDGGATEDRSKSQQPTQRPRPSPNNRQPEHEVIGSLTTGTQNPAEGT